jgi:transcriptional regulator with XRE-family HTH domain/DNA-directed RNA polymerase subunit RPC12/RpoP
MDQVKIGKFIALRRKQVGLTQMQLAEKLLITDRAVSKWERGLSMPDSSIMLDLCKILKITVNELLSGEVIVMEKYEEKLEQNLLEMVKEKERADRRLLTLEWVIGALALIVLFVPILIVEMISMDTWLKVLLIAGGIIVFLIAMFFALRIEQVAGYYKCAKCNHTYVPKYNSVFMAMHMGRTRYMKCPKCGKRSWQKKVVKKEE